MDEYYVTPPVINFATIFEQTTCFIPVCFILSAGSDPTNDLMKLAEVFGGGLGNFCYISLGQGQERVKNRKTGKESYSIYCFYLILGCFEYA